MAVVPILTGERGGASRAITEDRAQAIFSACIETAQLVDMLRALVVKSNDIELCAARGLLQRIGNLNDLVGEASGFSSDWSDKQLADILTGRSGAVLGLSVGTQAPAAPREALATPSSAPIPDAVLAGGNMARWAVDRLVEVDTEFYAGKQRETGEAFAGPSDLQVAGAELEAFTRRALSQPVAVREGYFVTLAALLVGDALGCPFNPDWTADLVLGKHAPAERPAEPLPKPAEPAAPYRGGA